jgi:hypothetical protein
MHGPTLPVPIFVGLHLVEAGVLAYDRCKSSIDLKPPTPIFVIFAIA